MTSPRYVVLNAQQHKDLALTPDPGFAHAAHSQLAAVVFQEVVAVASCMPVVVVAAAEGPPALSALLGLTASSNLFAGREWLGHVVPMSLQVPPFNYAIEDNQLLTLIDEASPQWTSSGQRLFAADNSATPLLRQRQAVLKMLASGTQTTAQFIQLLADKELLKPLTACISYNDGQTHELTGMYTVSESRLASLPAEAVKALHDNGMLAAIHAMLLSLRQFNRLVQLARQQDPRIDAVQLS